MRKWRDARNFMNDMNVPQCTNYMGPRIALTASTSVSRQNLEVHTERVEYGEQNIECYIRPNGSWGRVVRTNIVKGEFKKETSNQLNREIINSLGPKEEKSSCFLSLDAT